MRDGPPEHGASRDGARRVQAERPERGRPLRRNDHPDRQALRHRHSAPLLQGGPAPRRQLPRLRRRDQGRARARALLLPHAQGRDGSHHRQRARAREPEDGGGAAALRRSREVLHPRLRARSLGEGAPGRQAQVRSAPPAEGRSLALGDRGQPRRLHPVHALCQSLPRGTGQRRHRLRLARRALEDRVRLRRPDGRVHLRRLRRVRAGLSHRRPHAGARGREDPGGQDRRLGLPVLRCRVPPHLQRQGQQDPVGAGTRRAREFEPPVRERALRIRLRAAPAPSDQAPDPQAGRRQAQGLHRRSRQLGRRVPRGELGGSARFRRRGPARDPRYPRQEGARRLRLGQGHERGSVSLPEAGAHRVRLEQRRPLHAPVPRVLGRRAHGRDQLGRRLQPGARRGECGGDLPHRREPDGESPGRRDLDEERGQSGNEAHRRRPAQGAISRATRPTISSSIPIPTSRC